MNWTEDRFWSATPSEFWLAYEAAVDMVNGGPPPEPMTVARGHELEAEIGRRLKKKGKL